MVKASEKPYLINDKNKIPYYSLLFAMQKNDLKMVKDSVTAGAKIEKLKVSPEPMDRWSRVFYGDERISLIEYAEKHSSAEVYEYLVTQTKMTPERIGRVIIKSICSHEDGNEIVKKCKTLITKKNVNQLYKIVSLANPFGHSYSSSDRKISVTLLHVAIRYHNLEVVEWLLNQGADPNIMLINSDDKKVEHAGHILALTIPSKSMQQQSVVLGLKMLLKHGCDFDSQMISGKGSTVWEEIFEKLRHSAIKDLLSTHLPEKLYNILAIQASSHKLYEELFIKGDSTKQEKLFSKFPLIRDLAKYEKKTITIGSGIAKIDGMVKFFKYKSIKSALLNRYGINSPRLVNFFNECVLVKEKKTLWCCGASLENLDFLKSLYLDKGNASDFLDCMEQMKDKYLGVSINEEMLKFLENEFTAPQIKKIILNSSRGYHFNLRDILRMFNKFPKQLKARLSQLAFEKIDTFEKIHDVFSAEIKTLEQPDFAIDQVKYFPKLKNIHNVSLENEYGIQLATSRHELIRWGASMGHCIGGAGYAEEALNGRTILMTITYQGEPKFAVEISPKGNVNQVQGKSNSQPSLEVMESFVKILKKHKILNAQQDSSQWAEAE